MSRLCPPTARRRGLVVFAVFGTRARTPARHREVASAGGRWSWPGFSTSSKSMSTPARSHRMGATSTMRRCPPSRSCSAARSRRRASRRDVLGVAHRARRLAHYEAFNRRLLGGEDAEVTYRVVGLDGVDAVTARSRTPAPHARRQGPGRGHHLRHHSARRDRRPPRRGQRPLLQPARRGRRARLPRARLSRRPASRSYSRAPAATGCWAAPNPTPTWSTGTRPCTLTTGRLRRLQQGARTRRGR